MSTASPAVSRHDVAHEAPAHPHPTPRTYVYIGIFLAIVTAVEVWLSYTPALKGIVVPALLLLSSVKFVTVVGAYMHLRFDSPLFTYVFGFGLMVAIAIVTALILLFGPVPPPNLPSQPAGH